VLFRRDHPGCWALPRPSTWAICAACGPGGTQRSPLLGAPLHGVRLASHAAQAAHALRAAPPLCTDEAGACAPCRTILSRRCYLRSAPLPRHPRPAVTPSPTLHARACWPCAMMSPSSRTHALLTDRPVRSQSARNEPRRPSWQGCGWAHFSYFWMVRSSTPPVRYRIWPPVVDLPASTCPMKTIFRCSLRGPGGCPGAGMRRHVCCTQPQPTQENNAPMCCGENRCIQSRTRLPLQLQCSARSSKHR